MRSASSRTVDLGGTRHEPDFGNPMTKRWTSNVIHQKVSITNTKITSVFYIMDLSYDGLVTIIPWPMARRPGHGHEVLEVRQSLLGP